MCRSILHTGPLNALETFVQFSEQLAKESKNEGCISATLMSIFKGADE